MKPLFKTTIIIWSEANTDNVSAEELAHDADSGDSYCSVKNCKFVESPDEDEDWDDTEFFGDDEEEEEEEEDAEEDE
jgi:hypothetical protein